jgi:hypothetical protein
MTFRILQGDHAGETLECLHRINDRLWFTAADQSFSVPYDRDWVLEIHDIVTLTKEQLDTIPRQRALIECGKTIVELLDGTRPGQDDWYYRNLIEGIVEKLVKTGAMEWRDGALRRIV